MSRPRGRIGALGRVLALSLPLLATAAPAADGPASAQAGTQIQRGGELRVLAISNPPTLNPALTAAPMTTLPGAQIFASLFQLDAGFAPRPYLAERWRLAEDGLSLSVELVPNARFHDGRPVTSRDVAFSILAVRDHHSFEGMLEAVERVDTPTPGRAVIRLRHPHPALFLALSAPLTPILPAHVYDDGTPLVRHPANRAPIGSGPFRFVEHEPDGRIVLERFDDYFRPGLPYLDRIVFEVYPGAPQPALAFKAGEIQLIPMVPTYAVKRMRSLRPDAVATTHGMAGLSHVMTGLTFNLRRAPFDDPRVRRAIALALDFGRFDEIVLRGAAATATGPLPRGHRFADPGATVPALDLGQANRLLDQAGFPRDADGRRIGVELFSVDQFPLFRPIGDYLRAQLGGKLGIEITALRDVSLNEWRGLMAAGDFELSLEHRLIWADPLLGLHRTYHSDAISSDGIFTNYSAYASRAVDALLDAAAVEPDPDRRRALYARFQARIAEDLPILWLSESPLAILHVPELVFPTDSPWAIAQPYDRVHWREPDPRPAASGASAPGP